MNSLYPEHFQMSPTSDFSAAYTLGSFPIDSARRRMLFILPRKLSRNFGFYRKTFLGNVSRLTWI